MKVRILCQAVGSQEEKKNSTESNNETPADSGNANSADANEEDCRGQVIVNYWQPCKLSIDVSFLILVFSIPAQDKGVTFGIESFESVMTVYGELQASEDKQDKEDLQRLERHMTQARSLVKTYIHLEPEAKSDEDLLASLKESPAGNASGDAEKKTHTLVWYNKADAGEAQVQPHLRIPGLRNRGGHFQRFVRLVQQRKDPNRDLVAEDIYAVCDCGKDGNKSRLIGAFCLAPEPDEAGRMQKPAPCKKKVRTWTATMLESSITERLAKVRGFSSINQVQRIHLITKNGLHLNERQRLHSTGTNRGNVLGPFTASDSDAWQMKMKDKLVLLGKHGARIAVGGREDDDAEFDASEGEDDEVEDGGAKGAKARDKNDVEPFLFHSPPATLCEELIQAVDPIAIVALAADGKMAELCLERRIPFWGLGFTTEHCQALISRLEGRVFQKMQNDQSKLFAPALKVILGKNSNEQGQSKRKRNAKKGGDKGKGEEGAADPEIDNEGNDNGQEKQVEKKQRKEKPKKPEKSEDMLAELQKLAQSAVQ